MRSRTLLTLFLLLAAGCHPALRHEARTPEEALTPVRLSLPDFRDDLDLLSLKLAIERNLGYLDRIDPETLFSYGPERVSCSRVRAGQEFLLNLIAEDPTPEQLAAAVKSRFRAYRATGRPSRSSVLFTGYFEPLYDARLQPDEEFKHPIYGLPEDLVKIDLSRFHPKYRGERIVARVDGRRVEPYPTRQDIDDGGALQGRGLEIAWLRDPVDVAFLHIQGSGRLRLPEGRTLAVGYHAANGRPYRSIGKVLLQQGWLRPEEMSMQSIRAVLRANPEIVADVLNTNPAYVFFRVVENGPVGNIGVQLTPGRSLALDRSLFPKGALGYVACRKPQTDPAGRISGWIPFSRFVLVQDTGGAIRGAGRADLFWGNGSYAELAAGHMQHEGELYLLVPK